MEWIILIPSSLEEDRKSARELGVPVIDVRIPGMELVVLIPASLEEGRESARELEVPMRVRSLKVRIRGTHWCG